MAFHLFFAFKCEAEKKKARTRSTLNEAPRSAFAKNEPSRARWGAHSVRLGRENSRFSFSRTAYAKLLCRRQFNNSATIASTVLARHASDFLRNGLFVANIFQKNLIREG
jgi:hypothetical protein